MALYDGTYQDIANRLRDDDLISVNLLRTAAAMIERYGMALEKIEALGHSHGHGRGYSCANIAEEALKNE